MRHLILIGACYLDTILSVPYYPEEDEKLRSTTHQVRRGGNCPNSLEVLQELVLRDLSGREDTVAHLVSCLPERGSPATQTILDSLHNSSSSSSRPFINSEHCLYREGYVTPASCYIIRSAQTSSRTIVNYNDLPEMTADEFAGIVESFRKICSQDDNGTTTSTTWWHFEGRVPDTTLACLRHLRQTLPAPSVTLSVEVEKPSRAGLRELAAEADVVFYSKTWAESQGYASAAACLQGEADKCPLAQLMFCTWGAEGASVLACHGSRLFSTPVPSPVPASRVVDTIGAGDTFVAGILYKLACPPHHQTLAGRGVQQEPASAVPAPEKATARTGPEADQATSDVLVRERQELAAAGAGAGVFRHTPPPVTEAQHRAASEAEKAMLALPQRLDALAENDADVKQALVFAVDLASRKVQMDGFRGLV